MNSPYFILAHPASEVHKGTSKSSTSPKSLLFIFTNPFFQHTCNNCQSHHWFQSISPTGILQVSLMMPLSASGWELCKARKCLTVFVQHHTGAQQLRKIIYVSYLCILYLKTCFLTWNVFYPLIWNYHTIIKVCLWQYIAFHGKKI